MKAFQLYDTLRHSKKKETLTQNHKTHVHIPHTFVGTSFSGNYTIDFSIHTRNTSTHPHLQTDINTHVYNNISTSTRSHSVPSSFSLPTPRNRIWKVLLQLKTISPPSSLGYVSNLVMKISYVASVIMWNPLCFLHQIVSCYRMNPPLLFSNSLTLSLSLSFSLYPSLFHWQFSFSCWLPQSVRSSSL